MKPGLDLAAAALGLCLLAACGPKGGGAATAQAGGAAAPAASGPDVVIGQADLPHPRPGLWQNVIDSGDGHPETITSCLSGRTVDFRTPKNCAKVSFRRTILGAIVADMDCGTGQFHFTSHTVATGDFQSAMSSDGETTMQAPGQPPRTIKMHTEARWVGACPAGMKPDDAPDTSSTG
jgi:hypothetical protein